MAKSLQNIIDTIIAQIKSNFDSTVSTDSSSPLGQLIGIFAASDFELYELADAVKSQFNLSVSTGNNLDVLAKLFLANRKTATASEFIDLAVVGVSNQTIPTLQIGFTGSENTYTSKSFTFDSDGKATVSFIADSVGVQQINEDISNLKFQVTTSNPNVISVSAVSSSTFQNGTNLESDQIYRNRLQYSSSKNGTNIVDSLTGKLLESNYIAKALVYEFQMSYRFNPTTQIRVPTKAAAWKGGTAAEGAGVLGYFEPVVKLATKTDNNEIAQIIWDNNPPGVISAAGHSGDPNKISSQSSGTASDIYKNDHVIFFSIASAQSLSAVINIRKANQGSQVSNSTAISNIQNTLISYIDSIDIAGIARYSDAFCKIASLDTTYYIEKFTWSSGTIGPITQDIDLRDIQGARAYFTAIASEIVVTVLT